MTFLLNPRTKVAHERPTIEKCNADDMAERVISEDIPEGYRLCKWCERRTR